MKETVQHLVQDIQTWHVITAVLVWAIIGIYGAYLGTWHSYTHSRRIKLIWKYQPIWQILLLIAFGCVAGPIIYVISKIDLQRWKIRGLCRPEEEA